MQTSELQTRKLKTLLYKLVFVEFRDNGTQRTIRGHLTAVVGGPKRGQIVVSGAYVGSTLIDRSQLIAVLQNK